MSTDIDDIVTNAQAQVTALQAIDTTINQKIAAIKDVEWSAPLTATQQAQLDSLRAQDQTVLAAIEELSYVTVGALDQSDEITRIANALVGITSELEAKASAIAAIDQTAKTIDGIVKGIGQLATQVKNLNP